MHLTFRLSALHSHYLDHETVYDIGCDHGKLGLSFLEYPGVKKIHLVDPSVLVVQKLMNFIDSYITVPDKKLIIENKKGQDIIPGPEKKIIFIAGMGGKEILSILESLEGRLSSHDDVVISPHRDLLHLRKRLHISRFSLGKESLVFEDDRFYQMLSLNLRDERKVHLFGEEIFLGEWGEEYRQHQLSTFTAHQDTHSQEYVHYLKELTQRFS